MRKIKLILILGCLVLGIPQMEVQAKTMPFSVNPEFNAKQNKTVTDYYDMNLAPNEETAIQLTITNNSSVESQYIVTLENAFTNDNGLIDYQTKDVENGLMPEFTNCASTMEKISIPANVTLSTPIQLNMPENEFNGVLLGGIRVKEATDAISDSQITNTYSYLIPIKIRQGTQNYPDTLIFSGISVKTDQGHQPHLSLAFANPQPDILRKLQLSVDIKPKNQKGDWQAIDRKEVQMAPISSMNFSAYFKQPLTAGTYLVKIKGQTETFMKEWQEEFVIKQSIAKEINKDLGSEDKPSTNWLVVSLLLIVFAQMIIFLVYRRRKKNHETV